MGRADSRGRRAVSDGRETRAPETIDVQLLEALDLDVSAVPGRDASASSQYPASTPGRPQ
jgi:hypothetical protein